jgi:hypothetical protein
MSIGYELITMEILTRIFRNSKLSLRSNAQGIEY